VYARKEKKKMRKFHYIEEQDLLVFEFPYHKGCKDAIKEMKATYDPVDKTWSIQNKTKNYAKIKKIVNNFNFTINPSIGKLSLLNTFLEPDDINMSLIDQTTEFMPSNEVREQNLNIKFTPRLYQWPAANYMLLKKRVILGDDMGTGKTLESILALEWGKLYPAIIIPPASVKYNWEKFIKLWIPHRTVQVIDSNDFSVNTDITIINYDRLVPRKSEDKKPNKNLIKQFKCLIADEAHYLKNSKSIRSRAVKYISKLSEYIFLLTGTPVTKRPSDIISLLAILNRLDDFGGWKKFVYTYCGAFKGTFGLDISGATNTLELNKKLREICYIRREKEEVLKDLPPIQHTVLEMSITNKKEYNKAKNNFLDYIVENFNDEKIDSTLKAQVLVKIRNLRTLAAKGKMDDVKEWINNFLESSERRLVVFTMTKETINEIVKEYNCPKIDGSIKAGERLGKIKEFSNHRIIAVNIEAGGTGTDGLQDYCSDAIYIEYPDTPDKLDQSESRLHRSGQENHVNIYYSQAIDTIDVEMGLILESGRKIINAVNKGQSYSKQVSVFDQIIKNNLKR
jgi:SWI/SNF-related matrix-associated actin-dependent regulator 1 of chromatin subfamily A